MNGRRVMAVIEAVEPTTVEVPTLYGKDEGTTTSMAAKARVAVVTTSVTVATPSRRLLPKIPR